jgi:hypothetical protein
MPPKRLRFLYVCEKIQPRLGGKQKEKKGYPVQKAEKGRNERESHLFQHNE